MPSATAWTRTARSTPRSPEKRLSGRASDLPGAALPSGSKITPSGIQPDAKTPTVLSYNFKIEQQLAGGERGEPSVT